MKRLYIKVLVGCLLHLTSNILLQSGIAQAGAALDFGSNLYRQIGVGAKTQRPAPTTAYQIRGVKTVFCGRDPTQVLDYEGVVWVWGYHGADRSRTGDQTVPCMPEWMLQQ